MRRRAPGPAELEALDPLTGESLFGGESRGETAARTSRRMARARRLRRVAMVAALLAVACAGAATYFAVSIAQLRGIERTWRTAMALDAARADADGRVRAMAGHVAGDGDGDAALSALSAIGTEVAGGLRRHERSLADRRIVDSKVSDVRDLMVEALEFRRFQLSPTRNRIGDTPLQLAEAGLTTQLDRWDMAPSRVDAPELRSLTPALARLGRYADVETGTTLFALDGTTLHTIDVDRSTRRRRALPATGELVPTSGGVAVVNARGLAIYPPDPDAPAIATIDEPVLHAVAAGDGSGDLWVVQGTSTSVRRYRVDGATSGWSGDPLPLPPNHLVVGSTFDHLVLETESNGLVLWSPATRRNGPPLAPEGARLLDAEGAVVLFQGPLPFSPRDSSDFLHRVHVGTDRRDLIGLPRTDAASAAIGPDGTAAVAAGPLAGRLGTILLLEPDATALVGGAPGPRASVAPGTVAWADDGDALFWLTPDGAIAIAHGTRPGTRQLLRTNLRGLDRLVVMGR